MTRLPPKPLGSWWIAPAVVLGLAAWITALVCIFS
jgi:hypothetical protein